MNNNKWDFLASPRFWQLFLAGVSAGLASYSQTGDVLLAASIAIGSWLSGSVIVGTLDKNLGQARIKAAGVASGQSTIREANATPPQS